MEIVFLGTASNNPSPTRGVSSACFRHEGEVWMFDCGESTQIQLMKSNIKSGKITKIFISHLHGDHVFGLPGLMCTIGQNIQENKNVEIYGPLGLRRFIRTTLELSRSMVTYKYVVHELIPCSEQIVGDLENWKIIENDDSYLHPSEILGNQISMNEKGFWNLFDSEIISVKASWIKHRIPSFGFVVDQKPLPGKLDVDGLKKLGIMPGPIYSKIKAGENVQLSNNGPVIEASKYIGPSKPGKKITFLGDCCECSLGMIEISKNSDILIHEATLEDAFQAKALSFGHSTPTIAANFANTINAKCLILNHFSQRYKPLNYLRENKDSTDSNDDNEIEDSVQKLIDEAKLSFCGTIVAAYDLLSFKV